MALNQEFWKDKRVLLTGHTGFKGSWLSLWLSSLGARVYGYSLSPPTDPSLFDLANVRDVLAGSEIADVRDLTKLSGFLKSSNPEIVIHMAAQPLVRDSYKIPVETYAINVMGTVNVLEAVRTSGRGVKVFLNITTDKVYENNEWVWGYREDERLGGHDPYSNSKACSEFVTSTYRNSFFPPQLYMEHGLAIATARAGNVIGGGDFAGDRLIPDIFRSILKKEKVQIRNPKSVRPWQHVLEPLSGYLSLAEHLYKQGDLFSEGWNFGPNESDAKTVLSIVEDIERKLSDRKNSGLAFPGFEIEKGEHPHEAHFLKLDISKAKSGLNWHPKWTLETALDKIIDWSEIYVSKQDIRSICLNQIRDYESAK
ncbi:CDP-glucose 4,6-dehydratase [Leptospira ilyithenensis]|uniref:CDP-glucose 4,6-dehydratase n=1 Tax=Leptospira ilyithenensis TaxID=2484901 RepID=A0A4R9LM45_9LEPT|nr:CDP-glucose 4,6-dehydratase [Leptospira ilyithenensis]TGN08024.1 CDP-glucose 4,6-dehydratase [Leptospira ilyithenensis]